MPRSALDYRPGSKCIVTDVCVPISKLPEMVSRLKQDLDELKLVCELLFFFSGYAVVLCLTLVGGLAPIVGHVGDGNIHALILFEGEEERARAKEAVHKMVSPYVRISLHYISF